MKKNKIILLDFDRTLFDTEKFITKTKNIFYEFGINEQEFTKKYKKIRPYSIKKHVLSTKIKEKKALLEKTNQLIEQSSAFLFFDTKNFLIFLQKNNIKSILTTYGNKNFQNQKIEKSNIKKLLDKIQITSDNNKEAVYKKIINKNKTKKIFILDDLKANTKNITIKTPKLKTIKINRNKKNIFSSPANNYFKVSNLDQVKKIISQS